MTPTTNPGPLSSRAEIQTAYRSPATAEEYVERRFTAELNRLLHNRQVATVQECIDRIAAERVLEIAPGPGRLTRDIRTPGMLVGLEYNEAMIAQGRAACGARVGWVRGSGFQLPFDQAFDLVYSFRFIRHFHRADREALYAEIRRVLKPGGYFVFDAVNERVSRPLREADPQAYPIYDELYRPEALRAELRGAGFEPLRLIPVQKCYRWQCRSQVLLGPRAGWLNRAVIRFLERLPWRDGLEWVVVCCV
jgi:ubiquinone/menaquinone biosynthesis C-methylase UbiE